MTSEEIKSRLTPIFHTVFSDETLVVNERMTADDVSGWDSLTHINMIYSVEKSFSIRFSIKDARSMKNVGELIELIKKKTQK
jgi:acyl carrier protein